MTDDGMVATLQAVRTLVDEYRARCLWFLREDYYPQTPAEAAHALDYIIQHGDVAAFRKAAPLRQWLSRHSNAASVA